MIMNRVNFFRTTGIVLALLLAFGSNVAMAAGVRILAKT